MATSQGEWGGRWYKLDGLRGAHLERMRKCAEVTIPHILPPKDSDENTPLPTPHQGVGADAVNNLTAKLLLTMLPANSSFFKLEIDDTTIEQLKQEVGDAGVKTKVQSKLATLERRAVKYIEKNQYRVSLFKTLRYLITIGNCLVQKLESGKLKSHRLDKYVVRRDGDGEVKEFIIREKVGIDDLPEEMVPDKGAEDYPDDTDNIEIFTWARRKGNRWEWGQEALGKEVPDSYGEAPIEKFPFLVLTWTRTDGEHYGRSHVEDHLGDMTSLEGLSESLLEGAQIAALVKFLVNPTGSTKVKDLRKTPNGGFCSGHADDITTISLDKFADFRFAFDQSVKIEERLSKAFLLVHSIRRDAERVTAEEIRMLAQELEDALGGVYSVLAQELQFPLANLILDDMRSKGQMPPLPGVDVTIVTGFDALGRGHDLMKLQQFLSVIAPMGEDAIKLYISIGEYIERAATSLGIDTSGLVKTEDEAQAAMQQGQMQGMMEKLGPAIMKLVQEQMANGQMPQGGPNGQQG